MGLGLGMGCVIILSLLLAFVEESPNDTNTSIGHAGVGVPAAVRARSSFKTSSSEQVTTSALTRNDKNSNSASATGSTRKGKAVYIIAVVPDSKERLQALWSQLECFYDQHKFQGIVVAAPNWAKEENILAPFLQKAMENIPHLKGVDLAINYHNNDRYDIGLWCDSLNGNNGFLLENYDYFLLVNDSIMAIERDFTGVIDVLRERDLTLTSLNYSELDGYWVESAMRAFSKQGMQRYIEHANVPVTHDRWCPESSPVYKDMQAWERKRCIVYNFEITIARLFPHYEVWGIFPSDVPEDMVTEEFMNDGYTWVNHYVYWLRTLRWKYKFPAMKISNKMFLNKVRNKAFAQRVGPVFETCAKDLDASFLLPMEEMIKQHGNRLDPKKDPLKQAGRFKGLVP